MVHGSTGVADRYLDADHGPGLPRLRVDQVDGLSRLCRLCRRHPVNLVYALWGCDRRPGPAPQSSDHDPERDDGPGDNPGCVDLLRGRTSVAYRVAGAGAWRGECV